MLCLACYSFFKNIFQHPILRRSIHIEVAVNCDYLLKVKLVGRLHQGSIGEVHWEIVVFLCQFYQILYLMLVYFIDSYRAAIEPLQQSNLSPSIEGKHVVGFRDYRPSGHEFPLVVLKKRESCSVVLVSRREQRYEWARVNESASH